MTSDDRIVFIGPGVMAEAMATGLIQKAEVGADQITFSGPRPKRLEELAERYGTRTATDNRSAVDGAQVVVLSVKPQMAPDVADGLSGAIPPTALVLSIVADAAADSLDHQIAEKLELSLPPEGLAAQGQDPASPIGRHPLHGGQRLRHQDLHQRGVGEAFGDAHNVLVVSPPGVAPHVHHRALTFRQVRDHGGYVIQAFKAEPDQATAE